MAKEIIVSDSGKVVNNLPLKIDGEYLAGSFVVPMLHGIAPAGMTALIWAFIQGNFENSTLIQGFLGFYIPMVIFGLVSAFFTPRTYYSSISGESDVKHLKLKKKKGDGTYQNSGSLPVILTDGRITARGVIGDETIEDNDSKELMMPTHLIEETVMLKNGKPQIEQVIEETSLVKWDKAFMGTLQLSQLTSERGRESNVSID